MPPFGQSLCQAQISIFEILNIFLLKVLANLSTFVTPAKAGVQNALKRLDSGFRRNDNTGLLQEALLFKFSPSLTLTKIDHFSKVS